MAKTKYIENRWTSEQAVGTPPAFLRVVEWLLQDRIAWDLACTKENAVAPRYFDYPAVDSLAQDWNQCEGLCWINPPFNNIAAFAKKAAESRNRIAMLIPASVGTNYFADFIDGHAKSVVFVRPRIRFVGHKEPFPKDLMLCVFETDRNGVRRPTYYVPFRWDEVAKDIAA